MRWARVAADFLRKLTKPRIVVASAILLFVDWGCLPFRPGAHSRCASYFPFQLNEPRGSGPWHIPIAVYRTPLGLEARFRGVEVPNQWQDTGVGVFPPRTSDTGFWGLTSRVRSGVRLIGQEALSQQERDELVGALIRGIESEPDGPESVRPAYDLLKAGNQPATQRLAGGYIHNVFAVMLALLIVVGSPRLVATSIRQFIDWQKKRLADRRLGLGCCPRCGYDLKGDFSVRCPECAWEQLSHDNS
jgi:hypothetical protein